ncbi:MAG TPA: PQQ-dependent sugar dehydrogenase [Telluria sp.]|nr:PQQ-dependent sugar dehydrogenase [Telluria sp.]
MSGNHINSAAALAAVLAVASCGGGSSSMSADYSPLPTPASTPAPGPVALAATVVASGLSSPVFLTAPKGDTRQFIVERGGKIRVLSGGKLLATPFLDLSSKIAQGGEGGLLSMAFAPDYASSGNFYVYYVDTGNNIVVERRSVSSDPNVANPGGELRIISIAHPNYSNHFGGLVAFGPDGYLYLATGDGGGSGDPAGNAQNPNSLLGKMLRLDVAAARSGEPYRIPAGNPYAGVSGKRPEIWALGLRNPWRYAFDGGRLYIADVGQDAREEVDAVPATQAGVNYGWDITEGTTCYAASSCDKSGLTAPIFEYAHSSASPICSITGGYVYRGQAIPELAGHYFYSDYCAGGLKSFLWDGSAVGASKDWGIDTLGHVVSFGQDAAGELYILSFNGNVYKVVRKN